MSNLVLYFGGGSAIGENMVFESVCPHCRRFVKRDKVITVDGDGQPHGENAECKTHGRIKMPFEGYFSDEKLGHD